MAQKVTLFLLCFALWMVFSGKSDALFIAFGLVSSALSVWIVSRCVNLKLPELNRGIFRYSGWLLKEIIKSALLVTGKVWSVKPGISPHLSEVKSLQNSPEGYAIYGNSITLTPGTVTVEVNEAKGTILVHTLTEEGMNDIKSGEMDKRVKKICG